MYPGAVIVCSSARFTGGRVAPRREISRLIGYSRSPTHRLFTEWLGQAVTEVILLTPVVHAMRVLHEENGSLSRIGLRLGYFDQAHVRRSLILVAETEP